MSDAALTPAAAKVPARAQRRRKPLRWATWAITWC
jgi:hypothetical protein